MSPFQIPEGPYTIEQIMAAIREQMITPAAPSRQDQAVAPAAQPPVADVPARDERLGQALALMARRQQSEPEYHIHSHRPMAGRLIDPIKRLIHWGSRPYTEQVRRRQDDWNATALHALRLMTERLDDLQGQLAEADRRNAELHRLLAAEVDRRLAETGQQLAAIDRRFTETDRRIGEVDQRQCDDTEMLTAEINRRCTVGERRIELIERRHALGAFFEATGAEERKKALEKSRGHYDDIHMRQKPYLEYFRNLPGRVLDVGCGRGELLNQLRLDGIECWGVDPDPLMIQMVRSKGVHAVQGDALTELEKIEPGTLGGLFAAQVVEHLFPGELLELIRLARRALAPGGVMVLETLNPASLGVLSKSYYRDLDHKQPIHPECLKQLAELAGFERVELQYLNPFSKEELPPALPPAEALGLPAEAYDALRLRFERIDHLLYGPQDYYIIARQGAPTRAPEGPAQ